MIHTGDEIAGTAQRTWFESYLCKNKPTRIGLELVESGNNQDKITLKCNLTLEYDTFDTLQEIHIYTIAYVMELKDWRVVWLEKESTPFPIESVQPHDPFDFNGNTGNINVTWWENPGFLSLAKQSKDPLSPQLYARAIPRTVRFREAHPMLESAAILADCMSLKLLQSAGQIFSSDRLQLLANLYQAARERVLVRLVRADRDNTWTSKFIAPWYGFDEMVTQKSGDGFITGNCSSVMSFYFALLRLGGYGIYDLFQLRMHNYDALIVRLDPEWFLLASDKTVKLGPKTLYHSREIDKIFTERWFLSSRGSTNMPGETRRYIDELFNKRLSIFNFAAKLENNKYDITPSPPPSREFPGIAAASGLPALNRSIKTYVLENSILYPYSPFTWAKYAHQTLYVPKPETYAAWSIQSPAIREIIKEHPGLRDFLEWQESLGRESIFPEGDRIMTADQAARHRTADPKSRALTLFTWFKLNNYQECLVLITTKGSYCAWKENKNKKWHMFDTAKGKEISSPQGKTILAFDHDSSYYPLLQGNGGRDKAKWSIITENC
jgi:hypothetical protein